MGVGHLHKITKVVGECLVSLSGKRPLGVIEQVALLIHEAMSAQPREFHSIYHIFDVAKDGDPIEILAAFFHDVVYYQVDGGLSPRIEKVLGPLVALGDGEIILAGEANFSSLATTMCLKIFGFKCDEAIGFRNGQNEFLSALTAAQALGGSLKPEHMLGVIACIEATIPFRGGDDQHNSMIKLGKSIEAENERSRLGIRAEHIDVMVQRAAKVSNRDLGSFSQPDVALFLADTWKLFPEANPMLRRNKYYSVKAFRKALQKMEFFFSAILNPEHIFNVYKGVPSAVELEGMKVAARNNVKLGWTYLKLRLYSVSLIEAMAELSGGDAPMALFMGDRGDVRSVSARFALLTEQTFGPSFSESLANSPILKLLAMGRAGDSHFDARNSPLTAFAYLKIGEEVMLKQFPLMQSFWMGAITPMAFLSAQDPSLMATIATILAEVSSTRWPILMGLANGFKVASENQSQSA